MGGLSLKYQVKTAVALRNEGKAEEARILLLKLHNFMGMLLKLRRNLIR
jgi:hypothetical protein